MRICLAPMDGITDCAYRILCKRIFQQVGNPEDTLMLRTEFMSADGYYHNPPGVIKHLLKTDYDHETIAQIFGGTTETLIHCAQDIDKKYDFAGIELNMGCPSPKIMKCEAGSGMLKDKKKTLGIIEEISKSITTPFSLKTRIGLSKDDEQEQFDFLIEASKYVHLIAIHGRTYKQSHSGEVNRDFLYRLKECLPGKIIIGNGGIRSYAQALEQQHNLDGMMIAQSAIGNPWVLTPHEPTPTERHTTIMYHLHLSIATELYFNKHISAYATLQKIPMPSLESLENLANDIENGEIIFSTPAHAVVEFRKYLFNYISGLPESKQLKKEIATTRDYLGLKQLLDRFFTHIQKTNEQSR